MKGTLWAIAFVLIAIAAGMVIYAHWGRDATTAFSIGVLFGVGAVIVGEKL